MQPALPHPNFFPLTFFFFFTVPPHPKDGLEFEMEDAATVAQLKEKCRVCNHVNIYARSSSRVASMDTSGRLSYYTSCLATR